VAVVPNDQIATVEEQPYAGRAIPRISDDASPAAFGAGLGAGLESAANDVSQVAKYQAQQQKIAQDKANQDEDRVQLARAIPLLSQGRNQLEMGKTPDDPDAAYRQEGKALATLPEDYGAKFDKMAQEISATLTPHQQSMFAERVASEKDSLDLSLRRYQFEQGNRDANETFTNAKAQAIQNASLHYRDPQAIPKALEDVYNAGVGLAARGGKDQVEAYKVSGYMHEADQVIDSAISGHLADGDIRGAQRDLNTYADKLSGGVKKEELENKIRAAGDRIEAKQKDALHDKLADTLAYARAGGGSGNFSLAEANVLRPGAGEHLINLINQTAEAGAAGKSYDQMPVSKIIGDIDQRRAGLTSGGVEGAAGREENFRMLQQEANRSINERKDPQAFLQKTQDRPPVDFSKPQNAVQILNSRFNTMDDDSRRIEAPVRPLSKQEVSTFAANLDQQTSDHKLGMLYQYRQGLGDPRFRALMEDVRPQSPVTAKAALMLPRDPKTAPSWYDPHFDRDDVAARTVMQGQDIINKNSAQTKEEGKGGFKGGIELPDDSKFRSEWNDDTRVYNGVFAGRPPEADTTYQAAKSYYAAKVAMSGKTTKEVDGDTWREAMDAVIGPTSTYRGGHTVTIPRGMNPSVFDDYVGNALKATEKAWGLPKDSTKGVGLEDAGNGKYFLIHDNKRQQDDKGNNIYIDLNQQYHGS
jgi:hypothetical protein